MIDFTKLTNLPTIPSTSLVTEGTYRAKLIDVEDYAAAKGAAGHRFTWSLLEQYNPVDKTWTAVPPSAAVAINSIVNYGIAQTNRTADGTAFSYLPEAKFVTAVRRNAEHSSLSYGECIQHCLNHTVVCTAVRDPETDAVWFSVADPAILTKKIAAPAAVTTAPSGTAERFAL